MTAHEFLGILIQNYHEAHGVWKLMNFWEIVMGNEFLEFWNGN